MTTFRHTDLESLTEDLRQIWTADSEAEKQERKRELFLKISKADLEKWVDLCELFEYNYVKAFEEEIMND